MSTGSLPFVSADNTILSDLILPDSLRGELAKSFAPVIDAHDVAGYLRGCGRTFAVGDIVTTSLIEMGISPDITIIDYRTQRGPCEEDIRKALQKLEGATVKVDNPSGRITPELWNAIAKAAKSSKRTKIEVQGEEDLASLACIEIAEIGDCVIYGIPNEGISVIRIDEEIKKVIRGVLQKMAACEQR